jgi:hypothetical protein
MIEFEGLLRHGPIIWEHFCVIWADRAVRRTATWPATSLIEDDHFYTAPSVMRNRGRGHRARDASADDRDPLHSGHFCSMRVVSGAPFEKDSHTVVPLVCVAHA